jgi:Big-like domain-containing protein
MPQGVGGLVYLSDASENVSQVSEAGRAYFSDSYTKLKNHSPINVISASGGSTFDSAPVGKMYIRSESGNSIMWLGGSSQDAPYSGHGFPLWGGETSPILYVNNFNAIRVCASVSGQIVYAMGFLNGEDITLQQSNPVLPDVTAPFVLSHSPVSGLSGVARDAEVYALMSEEISASSVASGTFRLSPAHDVTVFRDTTDVTKIVMRPNVNFSGSTVYMADITTQVCDRVGNRLSGAFRWPFTTQANPPPPDTTPPVISGTNPVSGQTNVSTDASTTITFSESMLSGTINTTNIFLATTSGAGAGDIASTVSLDAADRKTVTVDPSASLNTATTYYINVTTGVQDLAGNAMASPKVNIPFTTTYGFTEVYNVTGTGDGDMYSGNDTRVGIVLTGSCALKGATNIPKRVTVRLKKSGSPTGTISIVQRRASDDAVRCTFGTLDAASLTTSYVDYTFTNLSNTEPMDTNNDKILVEFSGGNSSNKVIVNRVTSNAYSGAEWSQKQGSSSYTSDSAKDACFIVEI